jgi:hypothetical protein
MGQVRANPFRFHLDRDVDFVQYAITKKRLLAGLGQARARQLLFFIAEEGITAAAYVVVSRHNHLQRYRVSPARSRRSFGTMPKPLRLGWLLSGEPLSRTASGTAPIRIRRVEPDDQHGDVVAAAGIVRLCHQLCARSLRIRLRAKDRRDRIVGHHLG